jgi:hypothetical protein
MLQAVAVLWRQIVVVMKKMQNHLWCALMGSDPDQEFVQEEETSNSVRLDACQA